MNKSAPRKVLVIEDDQSLQSLLVAHLGKLGCDATGAGSCAQARDLAATGTFDLALIDIRLPDGDGLDLLLEFAPHLSVIVMTAYGAVDQAVRAVRTGASDYLVKPVSFEALELAIEKVFETDELKRDVAFWQSQARRLGNSAIVGNSPQLEQLRERIDIYGAAGSTMLIEGESGVGKELVARALHEASDRADNRFVPIDCDPSQADVLAYDLFGHEKGGLPGVDTRRLGMLEYADRGTIYLSDIAEVSLSLQSRILRVIETGYFRRFGGAEDIPTDVRLIVGTSHDLMKRVEQGAFRSELYFRLKAFRLFVPPLRDRPEDIETLAQHFMQTRGFQRGIEKVMLPDTLTKLGTHRWPGNVRELRNAIECAIIMSGDAHQIEPRHLFMGSSVAEGGSDRGADAETGLVLRFRDEPTLEALRGAYLELLLERYKGNRRKVADALGISERNTYRLISKLPD